MVALEDQLDAAVATAAVQRAPQLHAGHISSDQKRAFDLRKLQVPTSQQHGRAFRDDRPRPCRNALDVDRLKEPVDDDEPQWPVIEQMLRRHRDANKRIAGFTVDPLELGCGRIDLRHADALAPDVSDHRFACGSKLRKPAVQLQLADGHRKTAVACSRSYGRRSRQHDRLPIGDGFGAKVLRRELTWSQLNWWRRLRMCRAARENSDARADADPCTQIPSEHWKISDSSFLKLAQQKSARGYAYESLRTLKT